MTLASRGLFCVLTLLMPVAAAHEFDDAYFSSDITQAYVVDLADDEEVVIDIGSGFGIVPIPGLPPSSDLDAFHEEVQGDLLFSLDTFTSLSGRSFEAGDVVLLSGGSHSVAFAASDFGLPAGVDVDAVTRKNGLLTISFDTSVDLGSSVADDEDLVQVEGNTLTVIFDASVAGVDVGLDLDAAHWHQESQQWYVSFDGPGRVGTVDFEGRDVLAYDSASGWRLARRGDSAALALQDGADLDAFFGRIGLFDDGFESGDTSPWSSTVP